MSPMRRDEYPDDWDEIATEVKEAAGWRCQTCGAQCRRPGEPFDTHRRTLTVAHRDHNPLHCSPSNLIAECAPCHLRRDAGHHARNARRTRDLNRGQMRLPLED